MTDVERLSTALVERFGDLEIKVNDEYGWPGNSALCVMDAVLSLNRNYESLVRPRVKLFRNAHPEIVSLHDLDNLMSKYPELGDFFVTEINLRYPEREQILRDVVKYLREEVLLNDADDEWETLSKWAADVHPGDYSIMGVNGFAIAGFQYLRMLFGVQTTKPDVHITGFINDTLGRNVKPDQSVYLFEKAARMAGMPIREIDNKVWETRRKQ